MPINPETQALIDHLVQLGLPPIHQLEPKEARGLKSEALKLIHPPEPVAQVENRLIPGPGGEIPIRIYTPNGIGPFPVLVYFHGGGWVLGNLDDEDSICRTLANGAGCVVVSVDYRLAPEHKFPAAPEDAYAATKWVAEHAPSVNADRDRMAVGGLSAGGNLAAVVALMMRDRHDPSLVYQLLIDPVTQYGFETESYRQHGSDYLLTTELMTWFWHHYLPTPADGKNPYVSPLLAENLSNLPPALMITAELDILRDYAEAYGDRLKNAGVPVNMIRYDGTIHAFSTMGKMLPQAEDALAAASAALATAFAQTPVNPESETIF